MSIYPISSEAFIACVKKSARDLKKHYFENIIKIDHTRSKQAPKTGFQSSQTKAF